MLLVMLHPHVPALLHLSSALRAIPYPVRREFHF